MTLQDALAISLVALSGAALALGLLAHRRHRRTAQRVRVLREELTHTHGQLMLVRRELYAWRAAGAPSRTESHASRSPSDPGSGGSASVRPALHSQFGEDAFLLDLFRFSPTGFFIEAGAYDGVSLSATKVFEDLGWTGLLVEPLPERFEECVRNRPRSRVVRAALGGPGSSGTTTFQVAVPKSSAAASIVDMASQRQAATHQEGWVREQQGEFRTIEVPLASLATLLETLTTAPPTTPSPPHPIDLLVLDVEGAEAEALAGLDLSRNTPRVVVLEDLTRGDDRSAAGVLEKAAYVECVRFGHNRVFVRADDRELISRARELLAETDMAAPGFWDRTGAS